MNFDDLKMYVVPALAVVGLLLWFFVIRPQLAIDVEPSEDDTTRSGSPDSPAPHPH